VEYISVGANESWYLAKFVYFEIFPRKSLGTFSLDNFELEVVCLGNSTDGS